MDSNQYAIALVTYLLVLVVYFYELIVYMLLERNAFDSIAFFSQCTLHFLNINLLLARFNVCTTNEKTEQYSICNCGINFKKNDFFNEISNIFQHSALDTAYLNDQGISITKNLTEILKATLHKDLAIKSFAAQLLAQNKTKLSSEHETFCNYLR